MGKKRIVKKSGGEADKGLKSRSLARVPKKKMDTGVLHIQATYNNTRVSLIDASGGAVMSSSSGSLGFKGAKKGTPFAAAKVGELIGEKASVMGVKDVRVVIKGVGAGRESSLRAFAGKGIQINSIRDATPVPHNGPRPKKPRRV
jgi:small subunit ribosomal protein S11